MSTHRFTRLVPALVISVALASSLDAQTKIEAPSNGYSVADDVKLGRDAAAEARKELPLLDDERVDDYVERIGERLVAAIPPEYRHDGFDYTFDVVNQKEINAFALPGGPMFLNRGMIQAAKSEGEMAGVMAHEISHVALRHGTAQATKGQKFQIGAIAGQVLGAIVGGTAGSIIAQGSQFGLGAYFLKYGREYETQADVLGAQIMARAGYDPREMANMFRTIEAEGKSSGPEWLSSHPNPGNRFNNITREAESLRVQGNANTGQFASIKGRLGDMPAAYTAEQIAKGQARTGNAPARTAGRAAVRVEPPSTQYRQYQPGDFLRVTVPANWNEISEKGGVTYAPEGGFFRGDNGQTAFTHGVQIGVMQGGSGNLQRDTEQLLQNFAQGNPQLRRQSSFTRERIGGRNGLTTRLSNVSDVTGAAESVLLSTVYLQDNNMLYIVGVAPATDAKAYDAAFRRVRQSLQLADR
jgi:hypothetical protein